MIIEYHEQKLTDQGNGNVSRLQVLSEGGTVEVRLTPLAEGNELRADLNIRQTVALCKGLLDALQRCGVSVEERNRICDKLKLRPSSKA